MKFLALTVCFLFLGSDIAHTKAANDQVQRGLTLAEQVYNADNPIQARSNLTVEEQNLVDSVTQLAALKGHSQLIGGAENRGAENLVAAYTGCWARQQTYEGKALAGNTLFTYWQTTKVCARDCRVISVSVTNAGGETKTLGWRIVRAPIKSAKSVGWEGRGLAQYYFVLGAGGIDIQNPSNCIQLRLNANGRDYRAMKSCNLDAP